MRARLPQLPQTFDASAITLCLSCSAPAAALQFPSHPVRGYVALELTL